MYGVRSTRAKLTLMYVCALLYNPYAGGSIIVADKVSAVKNIAIGRAGAIGGAIFAVISNFTMNGDTYYGFNAASTQGGAVYLQSGDYTANGEHKYEGNLLTAPEFGNGGACYLQSGVTVTYNDEVSFVNNQCSGSGGAVYMLGCAVTFNKEVEFEDNSAARGDNVFYDASSAPLPVIFNGKSEFKVRAPLLLVLLVIAKYVGSCEQAITALSAFNNSHSLYACACLCTCTLHRARAKAATSTSGRMRAAPQCTQPQCSLASLQRHPRKHQLTHSLTLREHSM